MMGEWVVSVESSENSWSFEHPGCAHVVASALDRSALTACSAASPVTTRSSDRRREARRHVARHRVSLPRGLDDSLVPIKMEK